MGQRWPFHSVCPERFDARRVPSGARREFDLELDLDLERERDELALLAARIAAALLSSQAAAELSSRPPPTRPVANAS
jgi:hypothetical protein